MRFEVFHHGLLARHDIVAVDMIHYPGLWGVCFSHHVPNNNHPRYAADTTTEGVLRFLATESLAPLADYTITTHHFDADAILPVWALLNPELALERRDLLEQVARCGDFFIYLDDTSARLNFVLEAFHQRLRAAGARGERLIDDDLTRKCFEWLLPRLGDLLADPAGGEDLWRAPMLELLADLDYLAAPGRVTELWDHHTSLVESDHALDAHALNSTCRNDLLLIWRTDSPERRIDVRPALGWYDITSMPHRPRYDLAALAEQLNFAEQTQGHAPEWRHDAGPAWLRAQSSGLSQAAMLELLKEWLNAAPEQQVPAAYRADVREHLRYWPRHAIYTSQQRFASATKLSYAPGQSYGGIYRVPGRRLQVTSFGGEVAGDLALLPDALAPQPDAPLLFAVSDDFYWNRRVPRPLELRVTYQDGGAGSFWVEYDTWDTPFQPSSPVTLSADGATHTLSLQLDDARFGNSQDGGDLRIVSAPGTHLEIREVTLHKE
jgi:hypothetical protein